MAKFKLTNKKGQIAEIEAADYTKDGSGYRFYDDSGKLIADFADGELSSVVNETVKFGGTNE